MPLLNIAGGGGEKVGNLGNLPLRFVEKTREKLKRRPRTNCRERVLIGCRPGGVTDGSQG
jgi:hypothetical protein